VVAFCKFTNAQFRGHPASKTLNSRLQIKMQRNVNMTLLPLSVCHFQNAAIIHRRVYGLQILRDSQQPETWTNCLFYKENRTEKHVSLSTQTSEKISEE
jgi:hypothetical protein